MAVNRQELGNLFRDTMAKTNPEETQDEPVQPVKEEIHDTVDTQEDHSEDLETTEEEISKEESETEEDKDIDPEGRQVEVSEDLSIVDLASAMEVEPEFLYNIKIPMPDGVEPMTLSELKDSYTRVKHETDDVRQKIEKERSDFEEYKQQELSNLQMQMQVPQEIAQAQAKAMAIAHQYESFDWAELEKVNPGQAALQKQNMAAAFQNAQAEVQRLAQQHQEKTTADLKAFQQREYENMISKIPEWKDNDVRVKDQSEMRVMLKEYGYTDSDINSLSDHRAMRLARDLWKLRSATAKAQKTMKKVIKVPKLLKPGARTPGVNKLQKQTQGIQRAKEIKRDRDKAAAIADLMGANKS